MNDLIPFTTLKAKGHARIELYDALTGVLLESQEGDNFITPQVLNTIMLQMQKMIIAGGCPSAGLSLLPIITPTWNGLFQYLVLMDSLTPESPSTEYKLPLGNMVGWCNRTAYAGGSTVQGTINIAESWANENIVHWVFDFPTNAGNGTINSVCWVWQYPEQVGVNYFGIGKISASNWNFTARFPRAYISNFITYGDGYFWGYGGGSTYYKIDPVTFQEIATYTFSVIPTGNTGIKFLVNGGYIYFTYGSGIAIRNTIIGGAVLTTGVQNVYGSGNNVPIWIDSTYVYYACAGTGTVLYRIRVSDMGLADTKPMTSGGFGVPGSSGVLHQGVYYMVVVSSAGAGYGLFSVDPATGACVRVNEFYQDNILSSDGTKVYSSYVETYYFGGTGMGSNTLLASIADPTNIKYFNLMSRKLLASPVIKTSSKTMKIIYEFIFS